MGRKRWSKCVHLVLSLGRKNPCCYRHSNDYHQTDDDAPPVKQAKKSQFACVGCFIRERLGQLSVLRTRWPLLLIKGKRIERS